MNYESYDFWKLETPPDTGIELFPNERQCYYCDKLYPIEELIKSDYYSFNKRVEYCCESCHNEIIES